MSIFDRLFGSIKIWVAFLHRQDSSSRAVVFKNSSEERKMYAILHYLLAAYYVFGVVAILLIGGAVFTAGNFAEQFVFPQYISLFFIVGASVFPVLLVAFGIWRQRLWGYMGGLVFNAISFFTFEGDFTPPSLSLYGLLVIITLLLVFFLYQRRRELILSAFPVKKIALSLFAFVVSFPLVLFVFVLLGLLGIDVSMLQADYFEAIAYPVYFLSLGLSLWFIWK